MTRTLLLALLLLPACAEPAPPTPPLATTSAELSVELGERRVLADGSAVWKFGYVEQDRQVFCWIRERDIEVTASMKSGDWVQVNTARCSSFINDFDAGRL